MFRCSVLGPYIYVWVCVRAHVYTNWGFPGGSVVKNPPAMQETQEVWVPSLGRGDPLGKKVATHSSILAGKSHGRKA